MDAVRKIAELADPVERARQAGERVSEYQAVVTELSRVRREALEELVEQGLTHADIAGRLGMTRARVSQLMSSGPRTERAFLGNGPLTVALGGKQEAEKDSGDPGATVATEDLQAFESLAGLAKSFNLDAVSEVIKPPGLVDLNRDNLIVVCGPRLSPLIGQILASDPHLGFIRTEEGRWLLYDSDTETEYRSPMDEGEPADYAYFGRLPRPDGKGTFLYIGGIHAMGAPGVVHFLHDELKDAYRQVRTRRFSTLIRCTFDPSTEKVESAVRVTPYYRPEVSA